MALEIESASIVEGGEIPAATPLAILAPPASSEKAVAPAKSATPAPAVLPTSPGCRCAFAEDADATRGLVVFTASIILSMIARQPVLRDRLERAHPRATWLP